MGGWGTDARTANVTRNTNSAAYFIPTRLSHAARGFNSPKVIYRKLADTGYNRLPTTYGDHFTAEGGGGVGGGCATAGNWMPSPYLAMSGMVIGRRPRMGISP